MDEKLNKIAQLEQAIAKKWGEESIQNPRKHWDDEKEKLFLEQLGELHQKELQISDKERKIDNGGFFITEKLLNREGNLESCPVCGKINRTVKDDVYIMKYKCCYKCYAQWVEGREERWKKGWRPNHANNN
tara:strand:- start:2859 stop:3251 length:393 start_codon:yes stop_codon:yes gene_type:complete